ncbi:MAG TPA: response regulator transcription factor [Promineifilum sp.]|nr:response regulator transcription factor [Promineifilum sp.]HRO91084.1 response regulator transcription factor [Promineifilum sp.]HRQ15056.1 response regulator transcription factor [Promineifilum sp.]
MTPLRILIADDHPLFRKGMRTLLASMPETEVVGEATTGKETVDRALALQPDIVLMDLQMPEGGGLTAIRSLTSANPETRILVVTLFEDDESVFAALKAGARGYVLKDADEDEMIRAIQAVARGEAIFSPAVASRLMDYFTAARTSPHAEAFPDLTEREREILAMIARGRSNYEIAEELSISLKTVRNHASNIFSKLQVADRTQAAIRAREAGLT